MRNSRLKLSFWRRRRVDIAFQTEAAECSLACLVMIANYHGHDIDLASLRRRFSVSLKGADVRTVVQVARALELETRPLKASLKQLASIRLPCILHWDMSHFVVLSRFENGTAWILDPAVGERKLELAEVSKHFSGIALELTPATNFQAQSQRLSYRFIDLMGRVVGLRRGVLQLLLLGLALQVFSLIAPFFLQWTIDEAISTNNRPLISILAIGFLAMLLIQVAIGAIRSWVTVALAADLNFQWLSNAFSHLMRLPLSFFEKRHLGDILSKFGSIQTIQKNLTGQFVDGFVDGVLVILALVVMLLYSPLLTSVAALAIALYAGVKLRLVGTLRTATAEQISNASRQQTHLLESMRGIQSIQLFNRSAERRIGWVNSLAAQYNAELVVSKLNIVSQSASAFIFGAERILVIWLAAREIVAGRFTVGMLFAFLSYREQFSQRFSGLVDKLIDLRMLRLHAERVADIVMTPAGEHVAEPFPKHGADEDIEVRLENIYFRYADHEPDILKDVSLTFRVNDFVAIAGPSGGGKTTLVKVLLGLLVPTSGRILVNGQDLERFGLARFRALVGTVMQDDLLFAGSFADNISFFDAVVDESRIQEVARLAAISEEIEAMPMDYATLVGDIGSGLSGGQRQRILLARALYKQPRILVLDEATSNLDTANEGRVNHAIEGLSLTRIIVAHRPETIASARRVVVLRAGRIVDEYENASRRDAVAAKPERAMQ